MDPESVFKRYDIRGKYPGEIDEEFAHLLGLSLAEFLEENGESDVLVGRDTKDSSKKLKREIISALSSKGIMVYDAGVGPTDYVAMAGRERECYSVQVTSSHLPLDTNGFKFMYPEGNGLLNEDLDRIKNIFPGAESHKEGEVLDISEEASDKYVESAENFVRRSTGGIEAEVTVETLGGAGAVFLPELLERLGAEVEHLDTEVDPPEPSPENLEHLEAERAVATDMDADRVAYRNESLEKGEWLDGNKLFVALAGILEPSRIVASIDTSPLLEKNTDAEIDYTRVGDPFVISKMLENGAELSGEPNNHYCFHSFVPYNSGTISAALLLAAEPDFTRFTGVYTEKRSFNVQNRERAMKRLREILPESAEIVSEIDGVKYVDESEQTVLVRPSGTEEKVRVVAHGSTPGQASTAAEFAGSLLQKE